MPPAPRLLRTVLDTNVIFEGLTKKSGSCGAIIDFWHKGMIQVCVSDSLLFEYLDVLSRKLSSERWRRTEPVLGTLLRQAEYVPIHFKWRPSSPDPGDEHVIDCVMNAGAILVTSNIKDFKQAKEGLGLVVVTPLELLSFLI